jgi:hypothetical protein
MQFWHALVLFGDPQATQTAPALNKYHLFPSPRRRLPLKDLEEKLSDSSGSSGVEKFLIFRATILKKEAFLFPLNGQQISCRTQWWRKIIGVSPSRTFLEKGCYRLMTALSQAMEIN